MDYGICTKKIMKLDNSNILIGDIQCLWWCDFDKLAKDILTNVETKISIPKRCLYKTEAAYISFRMIEGKTIKQLQKNFNSKPLPQEHLRQSSR